MTRFLRWLRSLFKPKPGTCEICHAYSPDLKRGLCEECEFAERAW